MREGERQCARSVVCAFDGKSNVRINQRGQRQSSFASCLRPLDLIFLITLIIYICRYFYS